MNDPAVKSRAGRVASPEPVELVSIGKVSAQCGVSARTLRYYEELGLLAPDRHTPGGARRYGPQAIERVRRIRELQSLMGFDLEEIRVIVRAEDRLARLREAIRADGDPARRERMAVEAMEILDRLREQVRQKQTALRAFAEELDARAARTRRYVAGLRAPAN